MEKSAYKELKEKLLTRKKNGYDLIAPEELSAMEDYCAGYKASLRQGGCPSGGAGGLPALYAKHDAEPRR